MVFLVPKNCSRTGCGTTRFDGVDIQTQSNPPEAQVAIPLVSAIGGLLLFIFIVFLCVRWRYMKRMSLFARKRTAKPVREDFIDFIVPTINITGVYISDHSSPEEYELPYLDLKTGKPKGLIPPHARRSSSSSLSADDTSACSSVASDDDRSFRNPYQVSQRTLSRTTSVSNVLGDESSHSPCSTPKPLTPKQLTPFRRRHTMERFDIKPNELTQEYYFQSEVDLNLSPSGTSSSCEHGKLCFSVSYNDHTEVLTVVMRKALDLSPKAAKISADPYVKLVLLPDKKPKFVSNVHQRTLNPVFCETFMFEIRKEELGTKSLKMTVCDYSRFSRQNIMGYTIFPLKDSIAHLTTNYEIWRDLTEDVPFQSNSLSQGELLLGIKMEHALQLFTVSVLQGKDILLSDDEKEHGGIYVKCTMLLGQQVIKCKRTRTERKGQQCPVFNKNFSSSVARDCMNQLNVAISVFVKTSFSKSRLVGRTNIGPYSYASGKGLEHWINMLSSPSLTTTMWHTLS